MSEPPKPADQAAKPKRRRRASGSYAAADGRRAAIIDAAVAGFAQSGYLNSTLAKIAADAGTSATVVVHHFGSKENLLLAVLAAREERAVHLMSGVVDVRTPVRIQDAFRAILRLAEHNQTEPGLIRLYSKLAVEASEPGHPAHAYFVERFDRAVSAVADCLRRAADAGQVRPGLDPVLTAREIMAVSDGLQVQWAISPDAFDLVAAYRAYLDRLARSITVAGVGLEDGSDAESAGNRPPKPVHG